MLPELLGTNLCSLRQHVERFAFSVLWEMTPNAEIVKTHFTRRYTIQFMNIPKSAANDFHSVILSKASLTYAQAQAKIDSPDDTDLSRDINQLNQLARILKRRRMEAGALVLASPAMKFNIDTETHDPTDVSIHSEWCFVCLLCSVCVIVFLNLFI